MTSPKAMSLEEILDRHAEYYIKQTMKFFQENGESPALSKNNEGDLEAKQALLKWADEQRVDEVKAYEKFMIAEWEELCRRVRTDPNFGNSTKGKKDNFLDGAESMLTSLQYHRQNRIKTLTGGEK